MLINTLTSLTLLSLVSAGRQHYASKRNNHLAKKDLLSSVTYLQNVVTYQVCILAAGANAAVDAINGKDSSSNSCVVPVNPATVVAPVATPAAQLAAVPTVYTTISTTSVHIALPSTSIPHSVLISSSSLSIAPVATSTAISSTSYANGTYSNATITGSASSLSTGTAKPITASAGPHFLLYSDKWENNGAPPQTSDIQGWTVFALSFWLVTGPADMAEGWVELSSAQRSAFKTQYAAAGIKLITAAFGSTDTPTTSGYDPIDTANRLAAYVIAYNLDGVDVDYEDFAAMENNAHPGVAENWLIAFTTQLRYKLPSPQYIITHAPVAPWLTYNVNWSGGGYLYIDTQVGKYIDWYNVQFYDQGQTEYSNCTTLLYTSSVWPESALFQIAANGISLNKLLIGKPAIAADASNGYISTTNLAACVREAQQQGYQGGLSLWEYPDNIANYVSTIWGQ